MPFSEVVGHARPLGLLSRSIARGSLPPSLLFTGPEGVGKRLVAMAVAQALNCVSPIVRKPDGGMWNPASAGSESGTWNPASAGLESGTWNPASAGLESGTWNPASAGFESGTWNPASAGFESGAGRRAHARGGAPPIPFDACGTCPACRRIARGMHPDVVLIEAPETGPIKIEPIREVVAAAAYRPFEGRRRVVIVDEADRLNADAQDALLKSLEEPPASSVFVLVSSRPETLLATVRSRCSRLRFGRLVAADVAGLLVDRHDFEEREAHAAAAVADGSPGRAIEAATEGFQDARDAALGALRVVAGSRSPRESLGAAGLLIAGKSTSAREREELGTRLQMLGSLLRDVARLAAGAGEALEGSTIDGLANADLGDELTELARRLGGARAVHAFGVTDRAAAALARNANPKVVADWVAVRL